ncbi:MAG: cupin domain-containing protein [Longimicrobiales bacterium]
MHHPELIRPESLADFNDARMGKSTIFMSDRMLVGLNAFEPGQEHALHGHADQDKVYHVLEGEGVFLLEERDIEMSAGTMLVAPAGVPHGVRNTSDERLIVLVFMAPAPGR